MIDEHMPSREQQALIDNISGAIAALNGGRSQLAMAILDHMLVAQIEKLDVMVEIETLMKRIGL